MKTSEFLREILPEQGIYYAATWIKNPKYPRGGYWKNLPQTDILTLTAELKHLSSQGQDAYMALASFEQERYFDENARRYDGSLGKWRDRTVENATYCRSFFLDLDVKEGAYVDQREALLDLRRFLDDTGLLHPTHIVGSGRGLHVYWAFTQDIPKDLWLNFARIFKSVVEFKGLKADPAVTGDMARVLRPIGVNNFKVPDDPRPVVLLKRREPIGFKTFAKQLAELKQTLGLEARTSQKASTGKNADLAAREYPPSDAEQIADRCPTLRAMRDTLGAGQSEPLWYACLGVLAYTVQGDEVCHAWSQAWSNDAGDEYEAGACQAKIDHVRAESKPTRCETIRQRDGNACEGCTFKGKSPIVLGYPDAPQAEKDLGGEILPKIPESMQDDFYFEPGYGLVWVKPPEREGEARKKAKLASQFVVLKYVYKDPLDNSYHVQIETRAMPGVWEEASVPVAAIASGGQTLANAMGKAGVTCDSNDGMQRYMRTWYELTRSSVNPQHMRRAMGWQDDGSFVLGTDLFNPDGTITTCTLNKELVDYAAGHIPKGDLDTQVDLLDTLYNRPGMEARQFILASSLGSVLLPLVHPGSIGIPIAIWEPAGGQGKTTVCKAAIGLWGDPEAHGQEAHSERTTEYAKYLIAGIRRHLPNLVDETTMMDDPVLLAKFAYGYSSGKPKLQGAAEGGLRKNHSQSWQNFLFLTGNRSLTGVMTAAIPNCGPQLARIFEIEFNRLKLDAAGDARHITEYWRHTGNIGRKFIQRVVQKRKAITRMLEDELTRLRTEVDDTTDARYWLMAVACTTVAARIAKALKLFHFDVDNLAKWSEHQIRLLRHDQTYAVQSTEDLLGRMFSDLMGGILITDKWGSRTQAARISTEFPPLRGREIIGRYCTREGDLYVATTAVQQWCTRNMVDFKDFKNRLKLDARLMESGKKTYLTGGTSLGSVAQVRCWKINAPNMQLRVVPDIDFDSQTDNNDLRSH